MNSSFRDGLKINTALETGEKDVISKCATYTKDCLSGRKHISCPNTPPMAITEGGSEKDRIDGTGMKES